MIQHFGCLTPAETKTYNYFEIFSSVLNFANKLKDEWLNIAGKPVDSVVRKVFNKLPLNLVFESDSLGHAFDLWHEKAYWGRPLKWGKAEKTEMLRQMFSFLDPDDDGQIDIRELRISLVGLHISLSESDGPLYDFLLQWDFNNSGGINVEEFSEFVMTRIGDVFNLFLEPPSPSHHEELQVEPTITISDLRRVARELGRDVTEETLVAMITILEHKSRHKIPPEEVHISHAAFEQIVLVAMDLKGVRVEDYGEQPRGVKISSFFCASTQRYDRRDPRNSTPRRSV